MCLIIHFISDSKPTQGFARPWSCSLVTPQFNFCQNPQVFKASVDRENMEQKTLIFHRRFRILWKPSGRLMLEDPEGEAEGGEVWKARGHL